MKLKIPRVEFEKVFSRSSGPGGQSVNKLNSKVSIRLPLARWRDASWVPDRARERLLANDFKYLTKNGSILVQSEKTRSQASNLEDCFSKLEAELEKASWVPRDPSQDAINRWQNLEKREKKKMQQVKQFRKDKKGSRGRVE